MTAAPPEVHRTEVDGVPVFWVDTPGRLEAHLVFGVGLVDETFLTTGITHLLEHLVMRQIGDYTHAANASVSVTLTAFEVASTPEVVAAHLQRICRAISDLDIAALDLERKVLAAEEDHHGAPPVAWWPASVRYGNRGPGLYGNIELGPQRVTAADVLGWCSRWLHRGNATLVLSGPPPADLRLPLPDGEPIVRPMPPALALPTPAWTESPGGVLAAMHVPWSTELTTAVSILERRLTRQLRHDNGLIYELDVDITAYAGDVATVGIGADVKDEDVWTVANAVLDVLDDLSDAGPTDAEIAHDRESFRELLGDPDVVRGTAYGAAAAHLLGTVPDHVAHARKLTGLPAADVAAAVRAARASLVLGLPEGHSLHRLPELPTSVTPPIAGRVFTRRAIGSWAPRGSSLTLGADGVTLVIGGTDGHTATVRFADVVAVGVERGRRGRSDDQVHQVIAGSGERAVLRAGDWKDGEALVAALRAAVPEPLFFETPPAMRLIDPA